MPCKTQVCGFYCIVLAHLFWSPNKFMAIFVAKFRLYVMACLFNALQLFETIIVVCKYLLRLPVFFADFIN
jgi:hypothetical protein